MQERLMTKKQVAEQLGLSKPTIERMLRRGDLAFVRVSDRSIRIPEGEVSRLILRHTERGAQ